MSISDQTRTTIEELKCIWEEDEERQLALSGSPRRHEPHQDLHDPHHEHHEEEDQETGMTTFVIIPRETLPCPMELRATVGPAVQLATKPQSSAANSINLLSNLFVSVAVLLVNIPLLT